MLGAARTDRGARRQRVRRDDQSAGACSCASLRATARGAGARCSATSRRSAPSTARGSSTASSRRCSRRGAPTTRAPVRALLERRTRQMAIQCGEPGPFAQITGAVDQALWDIAARRAGVPLWKHLGGAPRVRVYASGIGPDRVAEVAAREARRGLSRVQVEGGIRCGARRRQSRRDARRARRRRDDHVRRQPGVDAG